MVERSGRERAPLLWYLVGAVAGGTATGVALGLLGLAVPPMPTAWALGGLAVVVLALAGRDAGWLRLPLPQNPRQVRQTVLRERPSVGAVMFGFEMGTGARTHMTGAAPYLGIVAVALAGGWWAGVACGLGFGLGRGLLPIDRELSGDRPRWDAAVRRLTHRWIPLTSLGAAAAVSALLIIG